jgi:hypothetical protein
MLHHFLCSGMAMEKILQLPFWRLPFFDDQVRP